MAGHHPRRVLASIGLTALLLTGCGSDDDTSASDVRDIRDTTPSEDTPDDDGGNDDGDDTEAASAEADDPDGEVEEDEPVTFDGVTVPDGALQINDDLDMSPEQQLEYLEFALEAFLYGTGALNGSEWDEDTLAEYYASDELGGVIDGLQHYEREGLRQVTEGAKLEYLRVDSSHDQGALVLRCVIDGPDDGVVDIGSGDYVYTPESPHWLTALDVERGHIAQQPDALRIVGTQGDVDASCP